MKFKFFLVKPVQWVPRYREIKLNLTVEAKDLTEARTKIYLENPGFEVSMFWPLASIINGKYVLDS